MAVIKGLMYKREINNYRLISESIVLIAANIKFIKKVTNLAK